LKAAETTEEELDSAIEVIKTVTDLVNMFPYTVMFE